MSEHYAGEVFVLKPEHQDAAREFYNQVVALEHGIEELCLGLQHVRQEFWRFIRESYPETTGWMMSLQPGQKEILLRHKDQ